MTPFEGTSTCIETARPLQLLEVLSSVCALVVLSSRSLTSLQTSGGPLTSSRITPDSLLPFVHPPPLSSERQRQRNVLCCICFAMFFLPGTTSALMRTFTRQQYSPYAPRNKKRNTCEQSRVNNVNIKRKKGKQRHIRKATCCCFFVFCFFCSNYFSAPCIYGWCAEQNASIC